MPSGVRLKTHESSGCGRFAKAITRRAEHNARSIRGRLAAHDDDLAEEAERLEEEGLDLVTIVFEPSVISYGWTVGATLAVDDGAPISHAGLKWSSPIEAMTVSIGALVRVSAIHFQDVAREIFGRGLVVQVFLR